jgi:hypothetical protein
MPVDVWYPISWIQLANFHWIGSFRSLFDRGGQSDHLSRLGSMFLGGSKDIPTTAPNRICLQGFGRQFDGFYWHNFIGLACFAAQLIEEIKPIISVVSDRSGFGLELSYDEISGAWGDGIPVQYFDHTIWQKLFELGWFMFRFTE